MSHAARTVQESDRWSPGDPVERLDGGSTRASEYSVTVSPKTRTERESDATVAFRHVQNVTRIAVFTQTLAFTGRGWIRDESDSAYSRRS